MSLGNSRLAWFSLSADSWRIAGAQLQQRAPSLHEIDELEAVYAQFVRTAPAPDSVSRAVSRARESSRGQSPRFRDTGALEGWGNDDADATHSLLEVSGRNKTAKGSKASRQSSVRHGAQSRRVRALVSPPRQRATSRSQGGLSSYDKTGSYAKNGQKNGQNTLSSRMLVLVSPPRERQKPLSSPRWNPNVRPSQSAKLRPPGSSAGRKKGCAPDCAGSKKETVMGRALREQLSQWHPAFTGSQTIHESLYSLHGQRQERMAQLRRDIEKARAEAELVVCRPWNADRLSSPERRATSGRNMAERSSDWLEEKARKQEKRVLIEQEYRCKPSPSRKSDTQVRDHDTFVSNLHDWEKVRLQKIDDKKQKLTQAEESGSFVPTISSRSKAMVSEYRGVEKLLQWHQQRASKLEQRREHQDRLEVEGMFIPNRAPRVLTSPGRSRNFNPADPATQPTRQLAPEVARAPHTAELPTPDSGDLDQDIEGGRETAVVLLSSGDLDDVDDDTENVTPQNQNLGKDASLVLAANNANENMNVMRLVQKGEAPPAAQVEPGAATEYASQQIDGAAQAARDQIEVEAARLRDTISHFRAENAPHGSLDLQSRAIRCQHRKREVLLEVAGGQLGLTECGSGPEATQCVPLQNIVDVSSHELPHQIQGYAVEVVIELIGGTDKLTFLVRTADEVEQIDKYVIDGIHELSSDERAGWLAAVSSSGDLDG